MNLTPALVVIALMNEQVVQVNGQSWEFNQNQLWQRDGLGRLPVSVDLSDFIVLCEQMSEEEVERLHNQVAMMNAHVTYVP